MQALLRVQDWMATPIGPVESWSPSLRTMVRVLLANRFPLLLMWGPDLCQVYNDAFLPVLGAKHPRALGQTARECWAEIWDVIEPLLLTPYNGGPSTWDDDLLVEIRRHGFVEEAHFTFAYSPVPDDAVPGGIGGVLATVHEITQQVIQERRLELLHALGARSADAKTAEEACAIAADVLAGHQKDVPFALLYLVDEDRRAARLAATAGIGESLPVGHELVDLAGARASGTLWPLADVLGTGQAQVVENLSDFLQVVPPGPWSDPPRQALVLPVPSTTPRHPSGLLVLGLSARLALDEPYRDFATLIAGQLGTAIMNARAYEEERKRADALEELDRAKTTFFSNVSHEFRTPLTLLLGPLEEALAVSPDTPAEAILPTLEIAWHNSLRLLRLVNTLLEFSRLEAGRVDASYEPTDLAALTTHLCSTFRSAIERMGLRLVVDCPPLSAPVYVDREMWEKIVLNLLSNALKFTLDGEIAVVLKQVGETVELVVQDTGVGIPAEELPHVFERFHRVRTTRGRTHEGAGIGLALTRELVALHGGTIRVASEIDRGTAMSVTLAMGKAHLPAERIGGTRAPASTSSRAATYVEETLRWLPDEAARDVPVTEMPTDMTAGASEGPPIAPASEARVLLADDNADMRDYLRHLLSPRYTVETVADGVAALAAARASPPDLILADVMMPEVDGFALLKALRSDAQTRTIPVILLSARAGEEEIAAGFEAGADDYLVKPFSATELLARVQAHVALARLRQEMVGEIVAERDRLKAQVAARQQAEETLSRQARLLDLAHDAIIVHDPHGAILYWNEGAAALYGWSAGEAVGQVIHDLLQTRLLPSGDPLAESDVALAANGTWYGDLEQTRRDGTRLVVESRHSLLRAADGTPEAVLEVNRDATRREHLARLHQITTALSAAVTVEQVANVVGTEGIAALGARGGVVAVLSEDGGRFTNVRVSGYPLEAGTPWTGFGADAPIPLADAVRRRELVILESLEERQARYPRLGEVQPATGDGPLVAIPLLVGERAIGGLGLDFAVAHTFTPEERTLMSALGELCAQALDRARLHDAEQQLRTEAEATLGQIADGVIITDTEGCTTFLNRAAKTLFGIDVTGVSAERRSEVYGMVTLEGAPFPTDELPAIRAIRDQTIVTGVDMCIRRPDGTEIGVQVNAAPIVAPNGAIAGAVATFRDVSAQRELERQKEEFLSAAAHDLKNPVAVLQGQAQLLQRWARGGRLDQERIVEGLSVIEGRARMMTVLIDELMDATRLRMGQHLELNLQQSDLTQIVRDTVAAQQAASEHHRLVLSGAETEIIGSWDTARLARVLENLLSNAVKFSPGGSEVQIRLHREEHLGQSLAVIVVRDQGLGIPSKDLPHVFDWFHRAENVIGTTLGTGIGLAVARQIVEQHGGTINVESEEGIGSAFIIRLPMTGREGTRDER